MQPQGGVSLSSVPGLAHSHLLSPERTTTMSNSIWNNLKRIDESESVSSQSKRLWHLAKERSTTPKRIVLRAPFSLSVSEVRIRTKTVFENERCFARDRTN